MLGVYCQENIKSTSKIIFQQIQTQLEENENKVSIKNEKSDNLLNIEFNDDIKNDENSDVVGKNYYMKKNSNNENNDKNNNNKCSK